MDGGLQKLIMTVPELDKYLVHHDLPLGGGGGGGVGGGGWGGGGGPEKNLDILGGIRKLQKWKFSNFPPSPPLINNERSLTMSIPRGGGGT